MVQACKDLVRTVASRDVQGLSNAEYGRSLIEKKQWAISNPSISNHSVAHI